MNLFLLLVIMIISIVSPSILLDEITKKIVYFEEKEENKTPNSKPKDNKENYEELLNNDDNLDIELESEELLGDINNESE